MSEALKKAIQEMGEAFNEFKSANDERLVAIEKGKSGSDSEEKLDKINDKLDQLEQVKSDLEELQKKGNRIGETDEEVARGEHSKAYDDFLRKGTEDGLRELELKAVNVGTDADGGFAVPEELDTDIERYEKDDVVMRQVSRVIPMSNENYKKLVTKGGVSSGWVGETDARAETSSPTLQAITPNFGEIYANPAATQKSLDDVMFDVEAWLAEEVAMEFSEQENLAFTTGDGTNKAIGFLAGLMAQTTDPTRAIGTLQYRLSGADSVLGATSAAAVNNLIDLTMDLRAKYRGGAGWMISNELLREARKLKDADDNLIWRPGLVAGQPSELLGYGVSENEDMPVAAAESNSVAFGNFKRGYTIIDVRGTRVLRDPFTNKPYIHFYTTKRVGSLLNNSEAIKILRLGDGA